MSKFNIKALREQANQPPEKSDNQTPSKPANQVPGKPDRQIDRQPDDEKRVNLCVKVPASWRKHWAIQAKIQEVTMTEVMVEALTQTFGLPDGQ